MANVDPQFLERATHLDPGMAPALNLVHAAAIGHVINDILGVAQGELQFVTTHGEEATIAARQHFHRTREVGRILGDADIVDLVQTGHDGQLRIEQQARVEDRFIERLALCTVRIAAGDQFLPQFALLGQCVQALHGFLVVQEGVVLVPAIQHAAPRSPARDREVGREEVVALAVARLFVGIEATDHTDALVVLVAVQHLLAEGEEGLCRYVIILEHDTLVYVREGPLLRDIFRGVAAVVLLLIHGVHFALPVHLTHHFAARHNTRHIALATWSVLIEEQARGACLLDLGKYLFEDVGTIEKQDQYGHIYLCGRECIHGLMSIIVSIG